MSKMQISTTLFWKMYNALRDAEGTLWRCDGATNPEDEDLVEEISETAQTIDKTLASCESVVSSLKEIDTKSN
jgi:hypothetical protein